MSVIVAQNGLVEELIVNYDTYLYVTQQHCHESMYSLIQEVDLQPEIDTLGKLVILKSY